MSLLLDAAFLAAASSHLAVDVLNSQVAILLAVQSGPLGLSNTLIGTVNTLYIFAGSLTQPLFGHLADRRGSRALATGGILWLAAMFSLALLVPGRASLTFLILAALGSGAFHPAGTTEATLRGRLRFAGREATAASYFFLFGQMGLSIGPVLGGLLLDHVGVRGLLAFLPLGVGAGVWTWTRWSVAPCEKAGDVVHGQAGRRLRRGALGAFILLTALRSWSQANLVAFFPKYYSDLGFSPGMFGLVSGLLMGGSAAGNLLGGWLGDRTSQRGVILAAMVAAAVPLSALPLLGPTGWAYPVAFLCGFLTGMPHSILVVIAQGMLPRRMATASGLVLGFTFASGSFGTLLSGLQADLVGFDAMFLTTAAVALLAGALSLRLPERIEREVSPLVAP